MVGDTLVSEPPVAVPPGNAELQAGDVLRDTYRVLGLLASGGTGNVFLAAHERLPGRVAVKTLRGERLQDAQSLARFRAEAEITAALRHPNIVQIIDFDVTPSGVPYLVMELVEGGDLRSLVAEGPCALERVARIVHQVASALELAHGAGVVHRDLKPANIMLVNAPGQADFVKIVDFGLSKLLAADGPPVTRPDQILGTPGYMAPEQIRGGRIDARVDQFALGSLTYELLTARPPFPGEDLSSVLHAIMNDDPPRLETLVPWPAAALSDVIARALAKSPSKRWDSVFAFEQAFSGALVEDGNAPRRPPVGPGDAPGAGPGNGPGDASGGSGGSSRDEIGAEMLEVGRNYRW